jgi:glycosyltransferase involved in cell wall biosynthesis
MTEPVVHILLATYQGRTYLNEQLNSLAHQTYPHWQLWVSDDGSIDESSSIVENFSRSVPQHVSLSRGPCKGSTHNFFHLMNTVSRDGDADLYAFCDQDDVWLPDKLASAVAHYQHENLAIDQPYLYCGATRIVDKDLRFKKTTPKPNRPLNFGNALLQNVASGNTMVFNAELLRLMLCVDVKNAVIHDWLAYQVATGCNGLVYYDSNPHLLYRQHDNNIIGVNTGVLAHLRRFKYMCDGQYKNWAYQTEAAMEDISNHLSPGAIQQLAIFKKLRRNTNAFARVWGGMHGELKRQTKLGQASLLVALFLKLL